MKKHLIFCFIISLSFLGLQSCNEEIDLVGEFKETAVIYGLLDQSESIHYIKINRAFVGPGNALDIAQIPDSSYFDNVEATVTEFVNDVQTRTWILDDTLLNTKSTNGIFYAPTEKVYYFTDASQGPLNESAKYKLSVVINKDLASEFTIKGETELVHGVTCGQSSYSSPFTFIDNNNQLKTYTITAPTIGNAYLINSTLGASFYEFIDNVIVDSVSFEINVAESEVNPTTFVSSVQGSMFFNTIRDKVTNNPAIDKRRLKSMSIKLTAGSEMLKNYISANKPSNSLTQSRPKLTNLSVLDANGAVTENQNVVGLFSSRYTFLVEKPFSVFGNPNQSCLDAKSRTELCTGNTTGSLLFCSNLNYDSQKSFYCPE